MKRIILVVLLLLATAIFAAVPSKAQNSFYSDRALSPQSVIGIPQPVAAPIPYGSVRVCSLPLTQQQPCLPLATITDINGVTLSNAIGSNFGQLTTDVTGKFLFGCVNGVNYQVQIQQSASNTPALNYPITCPGGLGAGGLAGNLAFTGNNTHSGTETFTGNVTAGALSPAFPFITNTTNYPTCNSALTAAGSTNAANIIFPSTGPGADCTNTVTKNIYIENHDSTRNWCNENGVETGNSCSATNFNYDDGNVFSTKRTNLTTNVQDLNGVSLAGYFITVLKNATANGNSGIDGLSGEANSAGTLTGTFSNFQAHEADTNIHSTGGTITNLTGVIGYNTSSAASTTAVTTSIGVWGKGFTTNGGTGTKPVNSYGGYFSKQTLGTSRNYSLGIEYPAVFRFDASNIRSGFDMEDNSGVPGHVMFVDNSTPGAVNIKALSTGGLILSGVGGTVRALVNDNGFFVGSGFQPFTTSDIGTASAPFTNLWLGTAATNNFKFQPGATTGARIITITDPVSPATVGLTLTIASGTATMTTAAIASGACGTTVTVAATGVATTDSIIFSPNGQVGTPDALLTVEVWPTANNVNFAFCNPTASSQTPTAATLNWRVVR